MKTSFKYTRKQNVYKNILQFTQRNLFMTHDRTLPCHRICYDANKPDMALYQAIQFAHTHFSVNTFSLAVLKILKSYSTSQ